MSLDRLTDTLGSRLTSSRHEDGGGQTATIAVVAAPALLVFQSSTSFIAARAVAPDADPVLFLFIRFLIVVVLFAILARNVPWPNGWQFVGHLLAGMVINGVYLCASWWAVANGLAAGVMTLIGALQPLFAAFLIATIQKRPIGPGAWTGLMLGFAGVALVLAPRLADVQVEAIPVLPAALGIFSILALTIGTMIQKSTISKANLWATGAIQHLGASVVAGMSFVTVGTGDWNGSLSLWLALIWSVLGLSLAGTSLFVWMVRCGEVTRVTALMLLVPPATALQAFFLFGETLNCIQLAGFVVTLAGVMLAQELHRFLSLGRIFKHPLLPRAIQADRGSNFRHGLICDGLKRSTNLPPAASRATAQLSAIAEPRSNGQTEGRSPNSC
jgi:drug/metabolite transporter (DMT)-like permease